MKRWWVAIALLLSLGVNFGLLAAVAARRLGPEPPRPVRHQSAPERPAAEEERPPVREEPPPPDGPSVREEPAQREQPPPDREEPPRQEEEAGREEPPPPDPLGPPEEVPGPNGDPDGPPRLARLADQLGLEGEARRRFLEVQWRFFERTTRLRMQQEEVQRELRRSLVRGEPDRGQIDGLLRESARIHLALEQALAENIITTRKILSPEQERQYLQIVGRLRREAGGRRPMDPPPMNRHPRPWRKGPRDRPPLGAQPPGEPHL
jgi:hypothetical protein